MKVRLSQRMERTPCREREAHEEVGLSAVVLKMIV